MRDIKKTELGYPASQLTKKSLVMPKQIKDEIPTLNKFGYMKTDIDIFGLKFIDFASSIKELVLELGAAYGLVTIEALKRGASIIANDISIEHLEILHYNTPNDYLKNLYLYPGSFPDEIDLPEKSVGAIYTARMMHFLEGEKIIQGLKNIHKWLKDDGKLFFVAVTPYHVSFRDNFLHIYKKRIKFGDAWPGRIENNWLYAPHHEEHIPQFLQTFDIELLNKILPQYGFNIKEIEMFDYLNDINSEGKGHVGFIATKN